MSKTTAPGAILLRPLAYAWFRGPATRERDEIVMDGRRAERYEPMLEPRIGLELSRVRTPDEAVVFVARFGMLDRPRVFEWEPCPAEVRQPFADFEQAAEDLRRILRWVLDVRKAVAGDEAALARVRKDFAPSSPDADVRVETATGTVIVKARDLHDADYFAQDDRSILVHANAVAAMWLSSGLSDAHPYVFEPAQLFRDGRAEPGKLRVGAISATLLGYCYLTVANLLASEPIAICDECNRVFVVDDKRQKFCSPLCSGRGRSRRHKTNHPMMPTSKEARSPHGKKTRTRRR